MAWRTASSNSIGPGMSKVGWSGCVDMVALCALLLVREWEEDEKTLDWAKWLEIWASLVVEG